MANFGKDRISVISLLLEDKSSGISSSSETASSASEAASASEASMSKSSSSSKVENFFFNSESTLNDSLDFVVFEL